MNTALMAKSAAAAQDKQTEQNQELEQLGKAFGDVMEGLDSFIKANTAKPDEPVTKAVAAKKKKTKCAMEEEREKEEEEEREEEEEEEREERKADMRKAVTDDIDPDVLDGVTVIDGFHRTLKKSLSGLSADLSDIQHQFAQIHEGVTLLAKAQQVTGSLLKALTQEVNTIGFQPRMRKSVLNIFEKPASGGGEERKGPNPDEVMAKAVTAQKAGRLTAIEVAEMGNYFRLGVEPPQRLLAAVEAS